jgi:hypothetical protein
MRLLYVLGLLVLAGCSQSVEIRAQGSHVPPGGTEPIVWVARYHATR